MKAHEQPSDVNAEEGHVFVDGPGGVAVALTPASAKETGKRLIDTADEAEDQKPSD